VSQITRESVVVFGAGTSGLLALRELESNPRCEVLAFADNALHRQGTIFEGLRVLAPEVLVEADVDRVVVASHGYREIATQLEALGFPVDRIQVRRPDLVSASFQDSAATPPSWVDGPQPSTSLPDRVHYACGQRVLDGWLNVDGFDESYPNGYVPLDLKGRICHADLTAHHPFPDEAFQWGYSEDFLEHLTQAESLLFLSEVYRTFKRGGIVRLSFPGLPGVLRRHYRSRGHAGAAACVEEAYSRWHHAHFYTFDSLELVGYHLGFSQVRRCEYGHSRHPLLCQESRPQQADLNIVVELTK
jgi:predicted SAM-dependent methyltransferase